MLTDEQWAILQPLLPPEKSPMGRPSVSHRRVFSGVLWLTKTGAPWRDLPTEFGPWRTVATRFYRWQRNGTWHSIFAALRERADGLDLIDWDTHCIDSTVVRAHQHAAGGKKGLQERSAVAVEGSVRKYICELIASETRLRSRSRPVKNTTHRN